MFVPSKREPMGGRECEERHLKNNKTIRHRQHEFTEGNLCSSHLVSFYKKVSCVVGEGKGVDVFWVIVRLLILLSFIVSSWEVVQQWDEQAHGVLGEEQAGWQGSKGLHWLVTISQWRSSEIKSRVRSVPCAHQCSACRRWMHLCWFQLGCS